MKKFAVLSIAFLLIVSGCSKEKILEKRLDGTWTIAVYTKRIYVNNDPVLSECQSVSYAGHFEFSSDGKGNYVMVRDLGYGAFQGNGDFTWTNTSNTVTFYGTGFTKKFDVTKNTSSKIELERNQSNIYYPGGEYGDVYSIEEFIALEK